MGGFQSVWFALTLVVGLLFWGFLLWMAWLLVSSVKGMHAELLRIRELLEVSARLKT